MGSETAEKGSREETGEKDGQSLPEAGDSRSKGRGHTQEPKRRPNPGEETPPPALPGQDVTVKLLLSGWPLQRMVRTLSASPSSQAASWLSFSHLRSVPATRAKRFNWEKFPSHQTENLPRTSQALGKALRQSSQLGVRGYGSGVWVPPPKSCASCKGGKQTSGERVLHFFIRFLQGYAIHKRLKISALGRQWG